MVSKKGGMFKMRGGMLPNFFGGMMEGPHMMKIVIILLIVIFVVVGIVVYSQYSRSVLDKQSSDIANSTSKSNTNTSVKSGMKGDKTYDEGTLEVLFFNVDWCAHCVKAKPDWQSFVSKYDKQNYHGYQVSCVGGGAGVNCTNSDDPEVKASTTKYSIQHYPTLIFIQNGSQVEFDARINTQNLEDFMTKL